MSLKYFWGFLNRPIPNLLWQFGWYQQKSFCPKKLKCHFHSVSNWNKFSGKVEVIGTLPDRNKTPPKTEILGISKIMLTLIVIWRKNNIKDYTETQRVLSVIHLKHSSKMLIFKKYSTKVYSASFCKYHLISAMSAYITRGVSFRNALQVTIRTTTF